MTLPSSLTPRVAGLPTSCSNTAQASGTSGAAPGQTGRLGRRQIPLAAEHRDDVGQVSERLERVLEHVEVVVGVLGDAAAGVELGQDDGERIELGEGTHGAGGGGQTQQRRELVLDPLAAHRGQPARRRPRRLVDARRRASSPNS